MSRTVRIIPARAGFTSLICSHASSRGDHPRSRGVYVVVMTNLPASIGSSPLARGLRSVTSVDYGARRIIPARAGFTMVVGSRGTGKTDHPRSRGVYEQRSLRSATMRGSSPLARGLHEAELVKRDPFGIIPARAGFTLPHAFQGRGRWDHPRSRGVYILFDSTKSRNTGSSPLARGLRLLLCLDRSPYGIIPARAGFTALQTCTIIRPKDHPRSRGVYSIPK